jgi:NADH-quinone oxidoreductase subunit I
LLAPLLPGMQNPPHPMWLGDSEKDYYLGALTNPGTSAGAEPRTSSSDATPEHESEARLRLRARGGAARRGA